MEAAESFREVFQCSWTHIVAVWLSALQITLAGLVRPPIWVWPGLLIVHGAIACIICYYTAPNDDWKHLGSLGSWLVGGLMVGVLPRAEYMPFWSTIFLLAMTAGGWVYFLRLLIKMIAVMRRREITPCIQREVDRKLGEEILALERELEAHYFPPILPTTKTHVPAGTPVTVDEDVMSPVGADLEEALPVEDLVEEPMIDASEDIRRGHFSNQDLKRMNMFQQLDWTKHAKTG